jgi:rhamnogalacturonyl hydrolase YesR
MSPYFRGAVASACLFVLSAGSVHGQAQIPAPDIQGATTDSTNHFGDSPVNPGPIATDISADLTSDAVKQVIRKVADWQLVRAEPYFNQQWTFGTLYHGFLAASRSVGDPKYRNAMIAVSEKFGWQMQGGGGAPGGPPPDPNAPPPPAPPDDGAGAPPPPPQGGPGGRNPIAGNSECMGQAFLELYMQYGNPWMLEPTQRALDGQFGIDSFPAGGGGGGGGAAGGQPMSPAGTPLGGGQWGRMPPDAAGDPTRNPHHIIWWWCDALYMAPPAWARMYEITKDTKYLDYIDKQWTITSGYLYDKDEHLYYRDASHMPLREANGKKVFWSRGEGWVMGGLARTLQYMPDDYAPKAKYVAQFKDMAARLAQLQGDDGLWRAGLLDPDSYGEPENSGSSFYVFAMAWGINEGILDNATYLPVVSKAWKGLISHIHADGRLDCIQQTGSAPAKFKASSSFVYGVGAFLLAGREMNRLALTMPRN